MISITLCKVRRKTGQVWQMRWRDSRGKRCGEVIGKVGLMDKRKANSIRRDREGKIDNDILPLDRPEKMTLSQFNERHKEIAQGEVSASTMLEYGHAFKCAEAVLGSEIQITSITSVHVARIRNAMLKDEKRPDTIAKTLSKLRAAFNRGQVTPNPFKAFKVQDAGDTKDAVIRTLNEISKLKTKAPSDWWRSLIGLWFTGLRRDEALSLRWTDISFDNQEVKIHRCHAGTFKFKGQAYSVLQWKPKAKNSTRTVPIDSDTMAALQQLKNQSDGSVYAFLPLTRLSAIQKLVDAGSWRADSKLVNNLLRDFQSLQRTVLGKKIEVATIHDSRKAFCTHMSDVIPIQALAEIIGDTPSVLMKYYTKTRKSDADKVRKLLGDKPKLKLVG